LQPSQFLQSQILQPSKFLQSQLSQHSQNSRSADETSTVPPRIAAGNGPPSAGREPQYRLPEGTLIEAVLTNRLDGGFAGPVDALVTTEVYSPDGQHLLIPAGSRVLGEARPVTTLDQKRLAVSFHRLLLPDGRAVSLDKFQGLNQEGDVGLSDQVNHHYLQVFGASLAVGALAGFAQANTRYGYGADTSATDPYRQGAASSFGQSAAHILDRYLNRLPSITIREGHRLRIYLSNDLLIGAGDLGPAPASGFRPQASGEMGSRRSLDGEVH
jgi:type IV secretion system protein VirB10